MRGILSGREYSWFYSSKHSNYKYIVLMSILQNYIEIDIHSKCLHTVTQVHRQIP